MLGGVPSSLLLPFAFPLLVSLRNGFQLSDSEPTVPKFNLACHFRLLERPAGKPVSYVPMAPSGSLCPHQCLPNLSAPKELFRPLLPIFQGSRVASPERRRNLSPRALLGHQFC